MIFSAKRDDVKLDRESVTAVVTDGNVQNGRKLHRSEREMRTNWVNEVRRRKKAVKKPASSMTAPSNRKPRGCVSETGCKDKDETVVLGRTGGIYLTMEGNASKKHTQQIVELRENVNVENNDLKEKSLKVVTKMCPGIKLWVHDLACKANFAEELVKHRMIDRFHSKTHTKKCNIRFNPDSRSNKIIRGKLKVKNTSICEQMWSYFNKHTGAKRMSRAHSRAFWRHCCIAYNKASRSNRPVRLSS